MSPVQKPPSDSIKAVPGRSKLRVESSNPVPRGNSVHKPSKVMLIPPEEAIKLTTGSTPMAISPPRRSAPPVAASRATSGVPVPVLSQRTPPRPALRSPGSQRKRKSARVTFEEPSPSLSRPSPDSPASLSPRRKARHVTPNLPRRDIVCGLPALSTATQFVRHRSNPSRVQSRTVAVEPPLSPRALLIRSRVKQQATVNATPAVQGTSVEVSNKVKESVSKETLESISKEIPRSVSKTRYQLTFDERMRMENLVLYRPSTLITWKGRIVSSGTNPELDCEFLVKPASFIRDWAHKFSSKMPKMLKGEVLPAGDILKDVFGRSPVLSDVEIYIFPDEGNTERYKVEQAHVFDGSTMIRVYVKNRELLMFSSKLLDGASQYVINTQKKTVNFLWGCFPPTKNSQTPVPDQTDAVDMDLDADHRIQSVAPKQTEESQSNPSRSPQGQVNREASLPSPSLKNLSGSPVRVKPEVSLPPGCKSPTRSPVEAISRACLPPGFEKMWVQPPTVKLNIHGTSKPVSGFSGVVRDLSGKWVFGYSHSHENISELSAGLMAIYNGLSLLWDSGFREIRLETTSLEFIEALTTNSNVFLKKRSLLDHCKDMILKDWKCDIYHITKEQNSCAEFLASPSRLEEQPQALVFYEDPPRSLIQLLEKDRIAA